MDILIIKDIINEVGIAVTITVASIWLVLDAYKVIKINVIDYFNKQRANQELTIEGIKDIAHGLNLASEKIEDVNESIKEIKFLLLKDLKEGEDK